MSRMVARHDAVRRLRLSHRGRGRCSAGGPAAPRLAAGRAASRADRRRRRTSPSDGDETAPHLHLSQRRRGPRPCSMERPTGSSSTCPRSISSCRPRPAGPGEGLDRVLPLRPVRARPVAHRHRPRPAGHRVDAVECRAAPTDGAALLTIELDQGRPRRLPPGGRGRAAAAPPAPRSPSAPPGRRDPRPVVVIDPGHGGIDPGARRLGGALEKDIVFAFAQRAARTRSKPSGRYRVVMTRDDDVFVPLAERVRIARRAEGRPLHLDPRRFDLGGAACPGRHGLYRLRARHRRRIGRASPTARTRPTRPAGVEPSDGAERGRRHPPGLTLRETRGFSHRFASSLVGELDPVDAAEQEPAPRGRLPGAARAGRALGAGRARLPVEHARTSTCSSRTTGASDGRRAGHGGRPFFGDALLRGRRPARAQRRPPQFHHRSRCRKASAQAPCPATTPAAASRRQCGSASRRLRHAVHGAAPARQSRTATRMRFVLRFFGFLFSVGAIVFLIGGRGRRLLLLAVSRRTCRITPQLAELRAAGDDARPCRRRQPARRIRARAPALPADPGHAEAGHRRLPVGRGQEFLQAHRHRSRGHRARRRRRTSQRGGKREQGASTITQQVAKNFLLTNERTLRAQDQRGAARAAHRGDLSRRTRSSSST